MDIFDDKQLEEILQNLPEFRRSRLEDVRFYMRLFQRHFAMIRIQTLQKAAAVSLATLVLFVFSGSMLALQSDVTYGSFLYPWKKAEEKVELAFARSPLKQVHTHLAFADRRLEELKTLVAEKRETHLVTTVHAETPESDEDEIPGTENTAVALTARDMVNETETAMDSAQLLDKPEEVNTALSTIAQTQEKQRTALAPMEKLAPQRVRAHIAKAIMATHANLSEVISAESEVEDAVANGETQVTLVLQTTKKRPLVRAIKLKNLHTEATVELAKARTRVEAVKKTFADLKTADAQTTRLIRRVESKLGKADEALEGGDVGKARGIGNAGILLTNDAVELLQKLQNGDALETITSPMPSFVPELKKEKNRKEKRQKSFSVETLSAPLPSFAEEVAAPEHVFVKKN